MGGPKQNSKRLPNLQLGHKSHLEEVQESDLAKFEGNTKLCSQIEKHFEIKPPLNYILTILLTLSLLIFFTV